MRDLRHMLKVLSLPFMRKVLVFILDLLGLFCLVLIGIIVILMLKKIYP